MLSPNPADPETPDKPSNPEKPDEPEKPGEPSNPEKPDMPGKPEKPGKEDTDSPNKKKKAELPKAGSEAEILTLAAAALSKAAGAYVSIRKRK